MHTIIGTVHLTVADLDRMTAFYQHNIGLQVHRQTGATAYLGTGGPDLLALTAQPDAPRVPRTTGLYHFALRVPSRLALAHTLHHLAETRTPLQGFADHHVSEAIYLPDPEGNGIEIYRDRPRAEWAYAADGTLHMGTDPLDTNALLREAVADGAAWAGLDADTDMGHIHLHVADIPATEAFYRDLLGLDVMLNLSSATFMAWDGYHHHVGANTWQGAGTSPPPEGAQGLRWYALHLPAAARSAALDRLTAAGVAVEAQESGALVHDPSGNGILLAA
jgi:catechol 2,3-dioxygenase